MRIGEAAKRAGVGVETVRFYELKGLIDRPPTPQNGGYREYSDREVRHIRFIRSAQQLGFTLSEIDELLALETGAAAQCADVRERASAKLSEANLKIENLGRIRNALEALIEACPGKGSARDCSILAAINNGDLHLDTAYQGD